MVTAPDHDPSLNLPVPVQARPVLPRLPSLPAPPPGVQVARVVDTVQVTDGAGRRMVLSRQVDYRPAVAAAPGRVVQAPPGGYVAERDSPMAGIGFRLVRVGAAPAGPPAALPPPDRQPWWRRLLERTD